MVIIDFNDNDNLCKMTLTLCQAYTLCGAFAKISLQTNSLCYAQTKIIHIENSTFATQKEKKNVAVWL